MEGRQQRYVDDSGVLVALSRCMVKSTTPKTMGIGDSKCAPFQFVVRRSMESRWRLDNESNT